MSFTIAVSRPVKKCWAISWHRLCAPEDRIEEVPKVPVCSRPHGVISADYVGLVINAERQDGAPEDWA
jgi:hypothetical protein